MSVVLRRYCRDFVYPTPFELHFSNMHRDAYARDPHGFADAMRGTDPDLAAHFTVILHRGIALYGPPVSEVFGDVPWADYLDSICADVADAETNVSADPRLCAAEPVPRARRRAGRSACSRRPRAARGGFRIWSPNMRRCCAALWKPAGPTAFSSRTANCRRVLPARPRRDPHGKKGKYHMNDRKRHTRAGAAPACGL